MERFLGALYNVSPWVSMAWVPREKVLVNLISGFLLASYLSPSGEHL